MASQTDQLRLTRNLLRLDNGRELVLSNTRRGGLLYFAEGRDFVQRVLDRVAAQQPLRTHGPDADDVASLVKALRAHHVLVPAKTTENPESAVDQDPTAPKHQMTLHLSVGGTNGEAAMPKEVARAATERTLRSLAKNGTCEIVFLGLDGDADGWQLAWDTIASVEEGRKKQRRQRPGYIVATECIDFPATVLERAKDLSVRFAFDWAAERARSGEVKSTLGELSQRNVPVTVRLAVGPDDAADTSWALDLVTDLPANQSLEFLPQSPNCPVTQLPAPSQFAGLLFETYEAAGNGSERLGPVNGMVDRLVHGGSDWYCGMPFGNAVAVDPTGNAHPCYGLASPSCHPSPATRHLPPVTCSIASAP